MLRGANPTIYISGGREMEEGWGMTKKERGQLYELQTIHFLQRVGGDYSLTSTPENRFFYILRLKTMNVCVMCNKFIKR